MSYQDPIYATINALRQLTESTMVVEARTPEEEAEFAALTKQLEPHRFKSAELDDAFKKYVDTTRWAGYQSQWDKMNAPKTGAKTTQGKPAGTKLAQGKTTSAKTTAKPSTPRGAAAKAPSTYIPKFTTPKTLNQQEPAGAADYNSVKEKEPSGRPRKPSQGPKANDYNPFTNKIDTASNKVSTATPAANRSDAAVQAVRATALNHKKPTTTQASKSTLLTQQQIQTMTPKQIMKYGSEHGTAANIIDAQIKSKLNPGNNQR